MLELGSFTVLGPLTMPSILGGPVGPSRELAYHPAERNSENGLGNEQVEANCLGKGKTVFCVPISSRECVLMWESAFW